LDTYLDALKGFPDFETKLKTEKGDAICQKQDIFKGLMWFAYTENFANWHVLNIEQVKEIIAENKQNKKVSSLEDFAIETVAEPEKDFNNAMGQESLTRFDQPKKSKNKNRNKNRVLPEVKELQRTGEAKPNGAKLNQNLDQNQNKKGHGQGQKHNQNRANPEASGERSEAKPADKKPIIIKKNENKE
jgi:hypothetical protein